MITVEKLRSIGISPEDGLGRCLNNEEFYLSLVKMIPGDEGFSKLEEALGKRDLDAAFEAAHALKGVLGNLSLNTIYDPVVEITELLRARTDTDYSDLMADILAKRDRLKALCED